MNKKRREFEETQNQITQRKQQEKQEFEQKQAEMLSKIKIEIENYKLEKQINLPKLKEISTESRENYMKIQEKQSEERIDKLVHLFHISNQFVTFDNLNEKIEFCLSNPSSNPQTMEARLENHEQKLKRQYENASVSKRQVALKQILFGLDQSLKDGQFKIRMKEKAENEIEKIQ
jgi:hypothetical protein